MPTTWWPRWACHTVLVIVPMHMRRQPASHGDTCLLGPAAEMTVNPVIPWILLFLKSQILVYQINLH